MGGHFNSKTIILVLPLSHREPHCEFRLEQFDFLKIIFNF